MTPAKVLKDLYAEYGKVNLIHLAFLRATTNINPQTNEPWGGDSKLFIKLVEFAIKQADKAHVPVLVDVEIEATPAEIKAKDAQHKKIVRDSIREIQMKVLRGEVEPKTAVTILEVIQHESIGMDVKKEARIIKLEIERGGSK